MIFLGRDLGEQRDYSQHVGELIDDEIRRFLDDGFARASAILRAHRDVLERLAQALIGQESLDAAALERIFGGPAPAAAASA
jgi:cell division protease FtsH